MKRTKRRLVKKRVIRAWKEAQRLLEGWRKQQRRRVIDVVPVGFLRNEVPERQGEPRQKFCGQLIFFTKDDVTVRYTSAVILVIDNFELAAQYLFSGFSRCGPSWSFHAGF